MLEFVKSNAGLFWIFSIAFVFQVVGAILVISEVIRVNRLGIKYQAKIDQATTEHKRRMTPDTLRAEVRGRLVRRHAETGQGRGAYSSKAEVDILTPFHAQQVQTDYTSEVMRLGFEFEARKDERPSWLTWLGPVTLVLGITLSFAGTMLAIR